MSYKAIDADVETESRGGAVSPGRVCREMATNANIHGAPKLAALLNEMCSQVNRENNRGNRYRNSLRALLFALHARPLFGGPHLSLEDAIAEANALLDSDAPGDRHD